ncbi:hypothetical protein Hanom_Chr09g00820361 [Helianthus anomalus]
MPHCASGARCLRYGRQTHLFNKIIYSKIKNLEKECIYTEVRLYRFSSHDLFQDINGWQNH